MTLQQIAIDGEERLIQVSQWKKQSIEAKPERPRGTSAGG